MPYTATPAFQFRLTLLLQVARYELPESVRGHCRRSCIPHCSWVRQRLRAVASRCHRSIDANGRALARANNQNVSVPIRARTSIGGGYCDRFGPAQNSPGILALHVSRPSPWHTRTRVYAWRAGLREYPGVRWLFGQWLQNPEKGLARRGDRPTIQSHANMEWK